MNRKLAAVRVTSKAFGYWLASFITLIFPLLCSNPAFADRTLTDCIHEICSNSQVVETVHEYNKRQETLHPDLGSFIQKFERKIEKLRLARLAHLKSALTYFASGERVEKDLHSYSDAELLQLFTMSRSWNVSTNNVDGRMVLRTDPRSKNEKVAEFIRRFVDRAYIYSPYYRAQALAVHAGITLPKALGRLADDSHWKEIFYKKAEARLARLDRASKTRLNTWRISSETSISSTDRSLRPLYELAMIGEFDLLLGINEHAFDLSTSDRKILEPFLLEKIAEYVSRGKEAVEKFPLIQTHKAWLATCSLAFNRYLHFAVSSAEQTKVTQMVSEMITASTHSVQEIWGRDAADQFSAQANSLTVMLPPTLDNFEASTNRAFQLGFTKLSYLESLLSNFDILQTASTAPGRDEDLESACNAFQAEPIRDAAVTPYFIISSYTARHPVAGAPILAHELGHIASQLFATRNLGAEARSLFMRSRKRLSAGYVSRPKSVYALPFDGDILWTEEDWADAFSAHVFSRQNKNVACALIAPESNMSFNTDRIEADTHSPNYYRVLLAHTQMNIAIPQGCDLTVKAFAPELPRELIFDPRE